MSTRRARSAVTGEQTEAGFQSAVTGLARLYGWRLHHSPDNRPAGRTGRPQATGSDRGFPDLELVRGPRLIFAELKAEAGRLGPGQADWIAALKRIGAAVGEVSDLARCAKRTGVDFLDEPEHGWPSVEVYVWRPSDWPEIQRVLGAGQEYRCDLDPLEQ